MYARSIRMAVGVTVAALVVQAASAELITIVSQSHHAWGYVEEVNYDLLDGVPVAGSCSKTIGTDFVQIASDTLGSSAGELRVNAHATSEEDYMFDHHADAEVSYVFRPNVTPLTIDFSGMSAHHSFESGLTYSLQDLTLSLQLDTRSWEHEMGMGWADDTLPYQGIYDLDASHEYRITIGAYAEIGDQREGLAHLAAVLTPEPGSGILVLLAAAALARKARRRCS